MKPKWKCPCCGGYAPYNDRVHFRKVVYCGMGCKITMMNHYDEIIESKEVRSKPISFAEERS